MKRIIIGCVMVLLCITGYAQVILQGRVSEQDGQALAGASVYLPDQKKEQSVMKKGFIILKIYLRGNTKFRFPLLALIRLSKLLF